MRKRYDLAQLNWTLSGWMPELWRVEQSMEIGASPNAEVAAIPAAVPGSVQMSLLKAGLIPDWNIGLNHRACEWVENRHWVYETTIPQDWIQAGQKVRLNCRGLDYRGTILVNKTEVGTFEGSLAPHVLDLTGHLAETTNKLRIVFDLPPRWLGQYGYTSRMREWKARFNYTWDWVPRLVQTGISESIYLEVTDGKEITELRCVTDLDLETGGELKINGKVNGASVEISLKRNGGTLRKETLAAEQFNSNGILWDRLDVDKWWPNLCGDQPLYDVDVVLLDKAGTAVDSATRRVGFRNVSWRRCEGAEHADPWICVVNGRPVFLQGVNWTPIRPNYADVTEADYRKRLELYKDLGLNIMRVWGGAFLERERFYNLCDELGLLVWQEFPLSSSGVENYPPDDSDAIESMLPIVKSYIERRQHHPSLIIWCGGNELMDKQYKPVDDTHPLIAQIRAIVDSDDPTRRFLATSASGPEFSAAEQNYGKGIHWDIHGPWQIGGELDTDWVRYWANDDALFRSEMGAPAASPADIIQNSAGELDPLPGNASNSLWRRTSPWWIEWHVASQELGREPESLQEYVNWSQNRQARALAIAVKACKDRFPRCGGSIIWMGHDCFPCTANTSIVDFNGDPKPAAVALKAVWRG